MFKTPILFLIFNRPETTQRVFEEIKKQKPKYLFVAADGARPHILGDIEKCKSTRDLVIKGIDWDCEVKILFRDKNLGCGVAVFEAITWFFENVEQGIILEDDCLPDLSFFTFCDSLLMKYRENKSIYHISGSNWQKGIRRGKADYYYSNIPGIWGWATWKDRWESYEFDIFNDKTKFKKVEENLKVITSSKREIEFHLQCFYACKNNKVDTWDYQWRFLVFLNKGLCIFPNSNLISNIGHGEDATHTMDSNHWRSNLVTNGVRFPLKHPKRIRVNKNADRYLVNNLISKRKKKVNKLYFYIKVFKNKIKSIINKL